MSTIPDHVVQAVRDAIDLVVLAGEHTTLRQQGRRWVGLCPFHREKSPSFGVDSEQGLFHCFGCGAGGDGIKFHMLTSGDDFTTAIETLARKFGIRWSPNTPNNPALAGVPEALSAGERFFVAAMAAAPEAREYLARRQIPAAMIERFRLGWAPPGWRNLLDAVGRSVTLEALERAGLVARSDRDGRPYDRFRHRLMFPIRSESGRLVGFGGRAMGDDPAKYLNTAETESFRKSRLLYGLEHAKKAIRERGSAILAEGYFDVIACAIAGHDQAVASMGTALTPEQAALLARYTDEVVVAYDGDDAGEKAYLRALPLLLGVGLAVRRLALPRGHDPDSYRVEHGSEALAQLIDEAPDAIDREIDRLAPAGVRRGAREQGERAGEIAGLLAAVRDPIARHGWARGAAERLGVPIDLLLDKAKALTRASNTRAPNTPAPPATASRREPGRDMERRLIEHLLATLPRPGDEPGSEWIPTVAPASLPPDEAFATPGCRAVISTWRALAASGNLNREALVSSLAQDEDALDELSRVLLGEPHPLPTKELTATVTALRERYLTGRRRDRQRELTRALETGDQARADALLGEIEALQRELHPRAGASRVS